MPPKQQARKEAAAPSAAQRTKSTAPPPKRSAGAAAAKGRLRKKPKVGVEASDSDGGGHDAGSDVEADEATRNLDRLIEKYPQDPLRDGVAPSPGQRTLALEMGAAFGRMSGDAFPRTTDHADVLKRLRLQVIAASKLGHRTSHALWGPRHAGKRTILLKLREALIKEPNVLTASLAGEVMSNDEDAVRALLRDICVFTTTTTMRLPPNLRDPNVLFRRVYGRDMGPGGIDGGGFDMASSVMGSLNALQDLLIDLNQRGVSLALMVSHVSRFALWCDRLMYIVAGLMHECEERAGGVSLIFTSEHNDIGLEKRLASRLTCEMWYVAPLVLNTSAVVVKSAREAVREVERQHDAATSALTAAKERHAKAEKKAKEDKKKKKQQQGKGKKGKGAAEEEEPELRETVAVRKATGAVLEAKARLDLINSAAEEVVTNVRDDPRAQQSNTLQRELVTANAAAALIGGSSQLVRNAVFGAITTLATRDVSQLATAPKTVPSIGEVEATREFVNFLSPSVFIDGGYASRESVLLLFFIYFAHSGGDSRTLTVLHQEITAAFPANETSGGRWRFAAACRDLIRWGIVEEAPRNKELSMTSQPAAVQRLLNAVLQTRSPNPPRRPYSEMCGFDQTEVAALSARLK